MSGFSFVADTNFLIDVHEGREKVLAGQQLSGLIGVLKRKK